MDSANILKELKIVFCLSSCIKLDFDIIALLIRTITSDLTPHFIADIFLIPSRPSVIKDGRVCKDLTDSQVFFSYFQNTFRTIILRNSSCWLLPKKMKFRSAVSSEFNHSPFIIMVRVKQTIFNYFEFF